MTGLIEKIEEAGNKLIDNVIIPISKGAKDIVIDNNDIYKSFLTFKTTFMQNKISLFIQFIQKEKKDSIVNFINNLQDDEKTYFIETINKVIDLDDVFQIFILSELIIRFNNNKSLNYWEKSLYYNIKSFSKDDFFFLFDFLESLDKPIQHKIVYGTSKDSRDELSLSIKKFESIGVISLYSGSFVPSCINLENKHDCKIAFSFYPFIDDLYKIVKDFKILIADSI